MKTKVFLAVLLGMLLYSTPVSACTTQTYIINGKVIICIVCLDGRYIDCW